jgi:hypothetical protein
MAQSKNCLPGFSLVKEIFNDSGKSQKHTQDISPRATNEDLDDYFVCLKIKKFDRNSKKKKKS